MSMKLQLYDAILNGSLQIVDNTDSRVYEPLSYLYSTTLDTKGKAEDVLTRLVRGNIQFDFSISDEADISMYLQADEYTEIRTDDSDISITIPISEKSPQERYYNALMRTEAKRIKFTLIDYANCVKDNLRAREQVKDVLNQILKYIAQTEEAQKLKAQPDPALTADSHTAIVSNLISALTSLYFELTIIFEEILPSGSSLSIEDFFSRRQQNQSVPDEFRHNYVTAQLLHRTLLAIRSDDAELISNTLLRNYEELPKIESKNFREATERLENHYFFLKHIDDIDIDNGLRESSTNLKPQSIMQRLTQSTDDKFRALGDVRGILRIINDRLLSLAFYSDHNAELHSVPRNYIAFLNEQRRLYEPHIADILTTTTSGKTIKAKKKLSKGTNTKIKTALKLIDFLSGENNDGKPIMSPEEYSKLQGYIEYFYENNTIPKVERPLWTDIDAQTVSYTIYLCKVNNDPGRNKEKTLLYATFVHNVFYKFKDTEIETIYRKFSTKPTLYDDIVKSK